MTGAMTPAVHFRVCLLKVPNTMPGKLLRSAHDSAESPAVMARYGWLLL